VYLYFFGYLIAELLQIGVLTSVPFRSNLYRDAWVGTESITICFYVLVVLELYSVALRDLAGIAKVSRRYIKLTLAVSILLSLLPLYLEKSPSNISQHVFILERAIYSSICFSAADCFFPGLLPGASESKCPGVFVRFRGVLSHEGGCAFHQQSELQVESRT